jgi:hypothetical protein
VVSGGAEDQVEYLRRELEIRNDELRRKDHQLAAALERIPAIEPPETPEAPKGASEKPTGSAHKPPEPQEPTSHPQERSWWRRFFGFE